MDNEKVEIIKNKYGLPLHYYGDIVRELFVLASLIMILSLPFVVSYTPVSILVSIIMVVLFSMGAGLIAPRNKWAIYLDLFVSVGAVIVFEYQAVVAYKVYSTVSLYFLVNQALAVIFLFASYFSFKTIRSMW